VVRTVPSGYRCAPAGGSTDTGLIVPDRSMSAAQLGLTAVAPEAVRSFRMNATPRPYGPPLSA
jgi:hypothetical protein